jgi:hypothetical protein
MRPHYWMSEFWNSHRKPKKLEDEKFEKENENIETPKKVNKK